jgi:hypothetical protein
MAKKRYINTRFWDDIYISNLDPSEKLLFLYFLTNQRTDICGIYEIPLKSIAVDTGLHNEMIIKILERFTRDKKIFYIDGWVYVKNFAKHQSVNESVEKGIERSLADIPSEIMAKIREINTVCDSLRQSVTACDILRPKPILKPKLKLKPNGADKSATKAKTKIQEIVDYFFLLKEWDKNKNVVYSRYVKPAADLLELCEQNVEGAKKRLEIVNNWANIKELDWSIETVLKRWFDLEKLPQEKIKKPYIENLPAYQRAGEWWVIQNNGEHKKWIGLKDKIEYK